MVVAEFLKGIDLFPKLDVSYVQKTKRGGIATVLAFTIISFLALSEIYHYGWRPRTTMSIDVDSHIQEWIHLSFRLTVGTECGQLLVAAVDAGGQKLLLNDQLTGTNIPFKLEDGRSVTGCLIEAEHVKLNRVNGKLVILPLTGVMLGPMGQLLVAMDPRINFSHHIDYLLFDDFMDEPEGKSLFGSNYAYNPLKDLKKLNLRHNEHVEYRLAVVPTRHYGREGSEHVEHNGAQYAVKGLSCLPGDPQSTYFLPGIYFEYDLEPLAVSIYSQRITRWQFCKRLFGIIGGIFVCSGLIHHVCSFIFIRFYLPWRNRLLYGSQLPVTSEKSTTATTTTTTMDDTSSPGSALLSGQSSNAYHSRNRPLY